MTPHKAEQAVLDAVDQAHPAESHAQRIEAAIDAFVAVVPASPALLRELAREVVDRGRELGAAEVRPPVTGPSLTALRRSYATALRVLESELWLARLRAHAEEAAQEAGAAPGAGASPDSYRAARGLGASHEEALAAELRNLAQIALGLYPAGEACELSQRLLVCAELVQGKEDPTRAGIASGPHSPAPEEP